MTKAYSKRTLRNQVKQVFGDQEALTKVTKTYELPENLTSWLSKLSILKGIPFNYLVPDEKMLPENSIRFFYLDPNWIDALVDGAFSIGRNLTNETSAMDHSLDAVLRPKVNDSVATHQAENYVNGFKDPTATNTEIVTGFLLRSSVVKDYPNMGVNAYPVNHSPSDNPTDLQLLPIIRYEQLGDSDVLLCLIQGDAYQVDLHQAPEVLHLGIDSYNDNCKVGHTNVNAVKNIRTFTVSGNKVTITSVDGVPTDISSDFRTNAPRVFNMISLSKTIAKVNNISGVDTINSAEMGFVMTEGVGTVSFINKTS